MEGSDDRIISVAADLFRLYGIKAVTMDMLAQHLGISKRTIYERFKDKDELLLAVMEWMIDRQKEKVNHIMDSSPNIIAAVFTMLRMGRDHSATMNPLIGSDLQKYHSNVLLRIKEKCENPDYEAIHKILNEGKNQGLFRTEIDSEIVGRFMSVIGPFLHDDKVFPPEKFIQRDLVKNIMISYLRGISTSRGLKIINELEPEF